MELTNNFNEADGGFLVDPNSSYGSFAVGIGRGASRNVTLFPRPSAGLWHHYALVLNTTAPAAEEVVPYVDGEAVAYTKAESGTGAGNFANATLNFMSRAGSGLFGAGDLDEVAIYDRALSQATISSHYKLAAHNMPPEASFTATPNPAPTNTSVTFDGSGSTDVDGTVAKYEWDLDGNGSYETSTGTTPTVTRSYSVPGERTIGLRVTDAKGATGTTTRTLTIQNQLPVASFTATPNPVLSGVSTSFNASASKDPDGTIAKYEWDLDGNGTYETSTGPRRPSATHSRRLAKRRSACGSPTTSATLLPTTQTVTVENRAPTASFTATPNPVLSGVSTSFDASGSSDPDGTVAKYEWDLNGDGTYETDTGTTPTVSNAFATSGEKTVGLRVTDNSGATATTTRTVTVQNRAPSASFTATPESRSSSGSNITFDASASKDPDGTITEYAWDLDGNGSARHHRRNETDGYGLLRQTGNVCGQTSGQGQQQRHRDDDVTVTVQNRAPSASFTATPNPGLTQRHHDLRRLGLERPRRHDRQIRMGSGRQRELRDEHGHESDHNPLLHNRRHGQRRPQDHRQQRCNGDDDRPRRGEKSGADGLVYGDAKSGQHQCHGQLQRRRLGRPRRHDRQIRMGSGRQRDLRDQYRDDQNDTKSYTTPGEITVGLRVTDNKGATGTTTKVITIQNQLPVPSFTVTPNPTTAGIDRDLQRLCLERPRRHDRQIRMGPQW